jgi:hypothetical protein
LVLSPLIYSSNANVPVTFETFNVIVASRVVSVAIVDVMFEIGFLIIPILL